MKEYVKKFDTLASANNYAIVDIPFTTSVATNPIQNLVCNESGKKLEVSGNIVNVVDNVTLINFNIKNNAAAEQSFTSYQAESGMTWGEYCNSQYNTLGLYEDWPNKIAWCSDTAVLTVDYATVHPEDEIVSNANYLIVVD